MSDNGASLDCQHREYVQVYFSAYRWFWGLSNTERRRLFSGHL